MFGFGKKNDKPNLVGAAEKRLKAQKYAKGGYQVQSKREGKAASPVVGLAIVYGLSVLAAYIFTEGPIKQGGLGLRIGNRDLDMLLFGPGEPSLTGDTGMDYILCLLLRGAALFIAVGIVPGTAWLWQRAIDRSDINVYRTFWGTAIVLAALGVLVGESLVPLVKDIVDVFFT